MQVRVRVVVRAVAKTGWPPKRTIRGALALPKTTRPENSGALFAVPGNKAPGVYEVPLVPMYGVLLVSRLTLNLGALPFRRALAACRFLSSSRAWPMEVLVEKQLKCASWIFLGVLLPT